MTVSTKSFLFLTARAMEDPINPIPIKVID
jgi:hypothetical protein